MAKSAIVYLLCLISAFLFGEILFLFGFFPISLENLNAQNLGVQRPTDIENVKLNAPQQKFNRTILMIVDALRHDFPKSGHMPYTEANACFNMQLQVNVPTVTMPRLKSISTGTISNFLDIVFNVGHTDELDDSLLHRLTDAGQEIVLAGDHTWLKLHPSEFIRSDANVQSFFVNDFYESDEKVTSTVKQELERNDWNILIAHYLGLDHIGHVEGTASAKLPAKLKEMDAIVQLMTNSKYAQQQLVLLTADHGMRNGGGHGGSSFEETHVPLYVFKDNCLRTDTQKNDKQLLYKQIDLAATLALLHGVAIPPHSIGCLIPEFFEDWSMEDQLYAYFYNAKHLLQRTSQQLEPQKDADYYMWFESAKLAHKQFLAAKRTAAGSSAFTFENAKHNYQRAASEMSALMSKSLVRFNFEWIIVGLFLNISIAIYILTASLLRESITWSMENRLIVMSLGLALVLYAIGCFLHIFTPNPFKFTLLVLPLALGIYLTLEVVKRISFFVLKLRRYTPVQLKYHIPLFCCFAFHTLSLTSSSFIEEEHQTWYYLGPSIIIYMLMQNFYSQAQKANVSSLHSLLVQLWEFRVQLFMLLLLPLLRRLNQTGDKWKHLQDVGDVLNKPENKLYLSCLAAVGLLFLLVQVFSYLAYLQVIYYAIGLTSIYCFNVLRGSLILPFAVPLNNNIIFVVFWVCYFILLALGVFPVLNSKSITVYEARKFFLQLLKIILSCAFLLAAFLHKPHNVILLPAIHFMLKQLYALCDKVFQKKQFMYRMTTEQIVCKTMLTIFVAKIFYFYQGNSNSLATIDLTPGYIGQTQYNPLLVATFVTFNTYGAYILSFLCWVIHMLQSTEITKILNNPHAGTDEFLKYTDSALAFGFTLYTALNLMPVAYYLLLMIAFRYHLFIYTVFSPKALYECFNVLVLLLNLVGINLFLRAYDALTC